MSVLSRYRALTDADKAKAVKTLIAQSTPDFDFFLLVTLAAVMAAFGLLLDSAAIIIGSMLIAPILYSVLSLSLGVVMSDGQLISRASSTLLKASLIVIGSSAACTLLFAWGDPYSEEILSRIEPSLLYFGVAIVSGIAIAYSSVKPELNETFPGVAISVALLPPLAVTGIGIARFDWSVVSGSLVLFLVNVIGIAFACIVSFSMMNLYVKREVAHNALEKEEQRVKKENKRIEKLDNKFKQDGEKQSK